MSIKNYDQLFDSEGKYITDSRYQEIHVLDKMLTKASIPHTMKPFMDGFQICYPVESPPDRVMDALTPEEQEHDSVLGCLSAKDVFKRIERHWKEANHD